MKIKKRWLLVVLISFTQLAVMLVGVIYFCKCVETEFRSYVQAKVLENNEALLADRIEELTSRPWQNPGDQTIRENVVNQFAEHERLPNNGYVGIFDLQTGRFVAHPRLKTTATQDLVVGQSILEMSSGQQTLGHTLNRSPDGKTFSGVLQLGNETPLVSAQRLPNSRFAILAVQSQNEMDSTIQALVQWLRNFGFGLTLFIGLVSTSLSVAVLRRYDDRVESHNSKLESLVEERSRSLMKTKNAIIFGLAKLAESRDTDTGEHLDRIRRYVNLLAQQLRLSNSEIDDKFLSNIGFACSLHDIGKVGIPDGILLKPGALTTDERFIMEQHAVIGGECLEAIETKLGEDKFLEMAKKIAYSHHERWDGTGYPYQLAGHDIPLEARIVSVADVYDALTTKRPYKRALSHEESKDIIVSGIGTQFDPDIVEAFLQCEGAFKEIAENQTGDAIPAIMAIDHSMISTPSPVT